MPAPVSRLHRVLMLSLVFLAACQGQPEGRVDDGVSDQGGVPGDGLVDAEQTVPDSTGGTDADGCLAGVVELCNDLDDDCDGLIDESYNVGGVCSVGYGACQRQGVLVCRGPSQVGCDVDPGSPSSEACNDIDDDCDGQVDEAYPELGQPCETIVGVCRSVGITACGDEPYQTVCSASGPSLSSEVCDGQDNDCDGQVDESFSVNTPCETGVGLCRRGGFVVCQQDGTAGCDGAPGEPQREACDGVDNDCDGQVDETLAGGPCIAGIGLCTRAGTRVCGQHGDIICSVGPGPPQREFCNRLDDDCDGEIDERWPGLGGGCSRGEGICRRAGVIECSNDDVDELLFEGVEQGLVVEGLGASGFELCWRGGMQRDGTPIEAVLESCSRDQLILGCRRYDAPLALTVAATGWRDQVLIDVGPEPAALHIHNGVAWYFNGISSWGFAPEGANVDRQTCDTVGVAGEQRMCWETVNQRLSGGGRCGVRGNNPADYERVIFHKRGGPIAECSAVPGRPALDEVCNAVDDDCDGRLDEGIAGVGEPCALADPRPCVEGEFRCQVNGQLSCEPVELEPQLERCNGADDDCDGLIDEDAIGTGEPCGGVAVGPCDVSQIQCVAPGQLVCQAVADPRLKELCNGLDDDCDGRIDETFVRRGQMCRVGAGRCQREGRLVCGGDRGELDLAFDGVRLDLTHEMAIDLGFTQCWTGRYSDQERLARVVDACSESELMLACRRVGRPELTVAATGRRDVILTEVGQQRSPINSHNGVTWYYSDGYSWGFAPAGSLVVRRPCDIAQGDEAGRLCWHTQDGAFREGYRCGQETGLNTDLWERILYQRNAEPILSCDARPGEPAQEDCNGEDDDCDGVVDEAPACP